MTTFKNTAKYVFINGKRDVTIIQIESIFIFKFAPHTHTHTHVSFLHVVLSWKPSVVGSFTIEYEFFFRVKTFLFQFIRFVFSVDLSYRFDGGGGFNE